MYKEKTWSSTCFVQGADYFIITTHNKQTNQPTQTPLSEMSFSSHVAVCTVGWAQVTGAPSSTVACLPASPSLVSTTLHSCLVPVYLSHLRLEVSTMLHPHNFLFLVCVCACASFSVCESYLSLAQ